MRKKADIALAALLGSGALIFWGCCAAAGCDRGEGRSGLDEYLAEMTELFRDGRFARDEMIRSGLTTREHRSKYEIIYTDASRKVFSYRCEGFRYWGGAHGIATVEIGTIEVATGRKLTVADAIPADKRSEALARVRNAVIAKIGGAEHLQGEVKLTENFCVSENGLHFVFQEYEVAAYCFGPIEVVIPAY